MKKFITAVLIAAVMLFCGFGCGNLSELYCFSKNAWNGGGEGLAESGVSETLTYNVSISEDFNENGYNFIRSSGIYSDLSYDITGTYTVNLSVIEKIDSSVTFESDILEDTINLIKVNTELNLTANYYFDGKAETKTDTISDIYYILQGDKEYAPLYSERTYDYNIVNAFKGVSFARQKGKTTALFNKTEYTVKTETYNFKTEQTETSSRTNKYNYKTLICNEELLFALRNINVEKDKTVSLPTESFVYNNYSTLNVGCFTDKAEIELENISVNGEEKDLTVNAKGLSYKLNSTQSGRAQLAYIQTAEKDTLKNRALMVKYVQPISEYGNQLIMGAMIYTLSSVSFS